MNASAPVNGPKHPVEQHRGHRGAWLRAAVLGANDGIVSTASLLLGVAASGANTHALLVAGCAGLLAGALSMAAGEYVSVSSQADLEQADLARERHELATQPELELEEMTGIYVARGLSPELAREVAKALTEKDALAAHARDELQINELTAAKPVLAAMTSAAAFSVGAGLPVLLLLLTPTRGQSITIAFGSLLALILLGAWSGRVGGASMRVAAVRVGCWGAAAMAVCYLVGGLFGVSA